MRRLFHLLLLFGLLFAGSSQTPAPDSGAGLLQEAQLLFDSAHYDQALQKAQQALQQAPEAEPEAADCLLLLGDIFLEKGELEAAQQQYRAALAIYTEKKRPRDLSTAAALNRLGEYFYKKTDYKQAKSFYKKALDIREKQAGASQELVADGFNNLGNCELSTGNYAAAMALQQKALTIRQTVLPTDHPDLASSFNNLGNCAYLMGNQKEALSYFEKALKIREKAFGPEHPKTAQVLNNLGNVCVALGLRTEALAHYRRALGIRQRSFGHHHAGVAAVLENMADIYFEDGDYIAALDFYRQAYAIQRDVQGEQSAAAATLWHRIGLCYQYEGDYDRALAHHLSAEPVLLQTFSVAHPVTGTMYNNLGNCFSGKKDFLKAGEFYERALQVFQSLKPLPENDITLVYNNLGNNFLNRNQAEQALSYFQKALSGSSTAEKSTNLKNKAIALERLNRSQEADAAFEKAVETAAEPLAETAAQEAWADVLCRRGIARKDSSLLRKAIALFERSRQYSDRLRLHLASTASRQRRLELQFPALAGEMEACYHLWQQNGDENLLEKAFTLAERNKSMQLLENLRNERAEKAAGIPDSLLQQERELQQELNRREKEQLAWQKMKQGDVPQNIGVAIAETRQKLAALQQKLKQQYPDYARLKYESGAMNVALIRQRMLRGGEALLEYFVSDSAVFVFVVTGTDFKCLRIARQFPLDEWVAGLRHSLQAYPEAGEHEAAELSKSYSDQAFQLYEAVFAPVQKIVQLPEKLIIIPDGTLAYLPFECLLSERPANDKQFKNHHYLIRDYCFSYAYSAAQQMALLEKKSAELPKNLLAVAPVYENNAYGLGPLKYNRPEAKSVCRLFNGKLLEGTEATVSAFNAEAGDYRVLLMAMHGKASNTVGDMSYVAFTSSADSTQNPFLFTRDLYTQSIRADLVVLSACETSVGVYRFGQGVISLAKGFFQAGARSVAATLWSVDDARNAELMRLFFQQIRDGVAKDEALHRAKLQFLKDHPHDEANPVYWAAVTIYGDMRPVELRSERWWWFVLAALAGVVFWQRKSIGRLLFQLRRNSST